MIYTSIARGIWEVIGNSGVHTTDTENNTRTCKGWISKKRRDNEGRITCKHLLFFMGKDR